MQDYVNSISELCHEYFIGTIHLWTYVTTTSKRKITFKIAKKDTHNFNKPIQA